MENSKRPRQEVIPNTASAPTTTIITSLPMATIAGQSFFLSTSANDCLGTPSNNVLLTICGENSDESQDYLSLDESLAHIKQEEALTSLQYRIVNPLRASLEGSGTSSTAILPSTVQLPSGCDIYLVKEYVNDNVEPPHVNLGAARTAIKLEPSSSDKPKQLSRSNVATLLPKPAAEQDVYDTEPQSKRSFILETYKKRDDKRRATHNEVERRRRDKINSWIFKLKEMLPDMPNTANNNSVAVATQQPSSTTATASNNNNRTPPSDSKSQILIKACEYIRTMQEELKSLRECLSENESLRSSNQRLQEELDKLKQHEQQQLGFKSNSCSPSSNNNNNSSFNITLNSLNSNGAIFGANTPAAASYTKRELIIRDYVD